MPVVGLLLNYNDAELSIRCIQSLLDQGAHRVVVWDNSADGGKSAASICAAFDNDRLDIQISARNLGFAVGVNRGLEYCAAMHPASWVLIINNDARLLRNGITKLVKLLDVNQEAKISFPNIDNAGHILGPSYCHRVTGLSSRRPRPGFFIYPSGCCMLIAIDRVGLPLFDEDFFMYGEDCELGWRLGQQPGAMVHMDETLVEHDGSASSGLGSPFYETHVAAAHLILASKLASSRLDMIMLCTLRLFMLFARAFVRSVRFRSLVPYRSLWYGWRIAWDKRHSR
jgi:N-acetylglucosaminyl-diphospho-decaprenol L-rhamnosyltransferase